MMGISTVLIIIKLSTQNTFFSQFAIKNLFLKKHDNEKTKAVFGCLPATWELMGF
jgi:hypothetical protein